MKLGFALTGSILVVCGLASLSPAREDYGFRLGTPGEGGFVYRPTGVPIYSNTLDPTVHRWYMPQIFFQEYGRRQWEWTNYARKRYHRYGSPAQDGDDFYDFYGDYVTRGYLVYDWRQTQPRISESSSIKQTGRFTDFFDRLIISSDQKGDFALSLMVGDEIAATLTPMTFRKAGFNGVVSSFSTGSLRATGIFSRLSDPVLSGTSKFDQMTNLGAGRLEADIGDRLTMGFTLVNSHNSQGSRDSFDGNPLKGFLTLEQTARRPNLIVVQLSDDSPEDNEGGAVLIAHDVEFRLKIPREVVSDDGAVTVMKDTLITGSSIGFRPLIEGGLLRRGLRTADGTGKIVMRYYLGPSPELADEDRLRTLAPLLERPLLLDRFQAEEVVASIEEVRFRMVLANDYRIEMSSDHQTNLDGVPQFRLITRADGNTRDLVNQREVVFSYGLPTALQTYGFTAEMRDFHGIDLYGELNVNTQYLKYPTPNRNTRRAFSGIAGQSRALGFMINASWSKARGPCSAKGSEWTIPIPPRCSPWTARDCRTSRRRTRACSTTSSTTTTTTTATPISCATCRDRWCRSAPPRSGTWSSAASPIPRCFPGTTKTAISYPTSTRTTTRSAPTSSPTTTSPSCATVPTARSSCSESTSTTTAGRSASRTTTNRTSLQEGPLGLQSLRHPRAGSRGQSAAGPAAPGDARVRAAEPHRLRDDHLREGLPPGGPGAVLRHAEEGGGHNRRRPRAVDRSRSLLRGAGQFPGPAAGGAGPSRRRGHLDQYRLRRLGVRLGAGLVDPAPGQVGNVAPAGNRMVATLDSSRRHPRGFRSPRREGRNGRARSGFFGVINKAEYLFFWRQVAILPRLKSELLRATPFSRDLEKRRSWDGIFSLQFEVPFLSSSRIRLGWEQRLFYDMRAGGREAGGGDRTGDFYGTALAAQLTNTRDYLGYALTTQAGIRIDRRSFELAGGGVESGTAGLLFLTMFAALR